MRLLNHIFEVFEKRPIRLEILESEEQFSGEQFTNSFNNTIERLRVLAENNNAQLVDDEEITLLTAKELTQFIQELEHSERACRAAKITDFATTPEGWGYPMLGKVKRYLPKTKMEAFSGVYWYQFGEFDEFQNWLVDKERLLGALLEEAWDAKLWLCPSFDPNRISAIVQRLPEVLKTSDRGNWRVFVNDVVENGKVVSKPVGVLHKKVMDKFYEEPLKKSSQTALMDSTTIGEDDKEPREATRNIPKTSFKDVGGIDPLLGRIREVIELPLKKPALFEHLHIKPHRGILLYGPPGCGKTMVAKAIAHEIDAHFISVKGPEILNKYYGQSEENLRKLFEEARELQPTIIFFDEIDAIAQRRSASDNLRMDARIVNQLLSLMDGVEAYGHVCVMAATNRIELIDEALLRPGRFDYKMEIPLPNEAGCKAIFDIQTKGMPFKADLNFESIYKRLNGFSGAEIAYTAREAAYNCLRRNVDMQNGFDVKQLDNLDFSKFIIDVEDLDLAFDLLEKN